MSPVIVVPTAVVSEEDSAMNDKKGSWLLWGLIKITIFCFLHSNCHIWQSFALKINHLSQETETTDRQVFIL